MKADRVYFWQVFFNFETELFGKFCRKSTVSAAFGLGAKTVFVFLDNFQDFLPVIVINLLIFLGLHNVMVMDVFEVFESFFMLF